MTKDCVRFSDLKPYQMGKTKREIYDFILHHPNCTARDVNKAGIVTAKGPITKRVSELYYSGWIVASGRKYESETGRLCRTYRVVDANPKPISKKEKDIPTLNYKHVRMMIDVLEGREMKGWSRMTSGGTVFYSVSSKGYSISVAETDGKRDLSMSLYSGTNIRMKGISLVTVQLKYQRAVITNDNTIIEMNYYK